MTDTSKANDSGKQIPEELRDPYEALNALYQKLHAIHGARAKEALGRLHWDRYYGDKIVKSDPIPLTACRRY